MLRTLNARSLSGWFSMHGSPSGLIRPLGLGAAALLAAFIQPAPGLIPFAWALLAAALLAGVQPAFVLAGCLAGMFRGGVQWGAAAGTAAVLAGAAGFELLANRFPGKAPLRETAAAFAAGLGALAGGFAPSVGGTDMLLRTVAASAVAAAAAPLLLDWARTGPGRRYLMPGERAGLIVLLGASLAGLGAVCPLAAMAAAFAGTLILSGSGPGTGACAGLAAGGAMLLTGADPTVPAALGVCGLMAGLAPSRRRWAAPLALCAGAGVSVLFLEIPYKEALCALAACAGVLALPERHVRRLRSRIVGEADLSGDPDRLARRLRSETGRQLRALSAAFGELSDGYRAPVEIPDEQTLIADMRAALCENCSNYESCWAGGDNRAVRFLCQLISEAIEWGNGDHAHPLFDDDPPPVLLRACRRGRSVAARLGPMLEDFARARRAGMKRSAVNQLISAQFMQAQLLLQGMAEAQEKPVRVRGRHAVRARAALDRAGIPADDVMALRGARSMEIAATLRSGLWTGALADRAARSLTRAFGRAYAPGESPGRCEMKFVRLPALRAAAASGCHSLHPGTPSGDSHMIRMLSGDRLLMMISDGMGSGEAAARESAQTLRLLWQFLSAGVGRELAIDTVNELMLARSGEDMFATVDLCIIDLNTGLAEFAKLAACKSYILRDGEILEVEGGRLPLGILEQVQPSVTRVRLRPGDVVLMGSDGVMEALPEPELLRLFNLHRHLPPQQLSESILTALSTNPTHPDDQSLLSCRLNLHTIAAALTESAAVAAASVRPDSTRLW